VAFLGRSECSDCEHDMRHLVRNDERELRDDEVFEKGNLPRDSPYDTVECVVRRYAERATATLAYVHSVADYFEVTGVDMLPFLRVDLLPVDHVERAMVSPNLSITVTEDEVCGREVDPAIEVHDEAHYLFTYIFV
jgi:hypothetical protein